MKVLIENPYIIPGLIRGHQNHLRVKPTDNLFEKVIQAVCNYYGFTPAQIKGACRQMPLPQARQIFCFLCIQRTIRKHSQIAQFINNDRSSVYYASKVLNDAIDTNNREILDPLEIIKLSL
jgi:chromosomal replication initiation ATPase DnaA